MTTDIQVHPNQDVLRELREIQRALVTLRPRYQHFHKDVFFFQNPGWTSPYRVLVERIIILPATPVQTRFTVGSRWLWELETATGGAHDIEFPWTIEQGSNVSLRDTGGVLTSIASIPSAWIIGWIEEPNIDVGAANLIDAGSA